MIAVQVVDSAKRLKQFIELPFRLYANDPLWIAPLRSDMKRMLSPRHNPFFREAEIEHFLAVDAQGQVQGRISVSIHAAYNERFGDEHVFFGLFEVAQDPAVARALFDAVGNWAKVRGKSRLLGPYSYTSTQDAARCRRISTAVRRRCCRPTTRSGMPTPSSTWVSNWPLPSAPTV